jgi:hypothetical protein
MRKIRVRKIGGKSVSAKIGVMGKSVRKSGRVASGDCSADEDNLIFCGRIGKMEKVASFEPALTR